MTKKRLHIPRKIEDAVLSEFNHRCAVCGDDRPQLHHIDEDTSNNSLVNLIPLCPNCHLTDVHHPTKPIPEKVLSLFRKWQDPSILTPQFRPLFRRFECLRYNEGKYGVLRLFVSDFISFVENLRMGGYYGKSIRSMLPMTLIDEVSDEEAMAYVAAWSDEEAVRRIRLALDEHIDFIESHMIELLRFQRWSFSPRCRKR